MTPTGTYGYIFARPAHRPGQGTEAPKGAFDALINALPPRINGDNWLTLDAYRFGFDLAQNGYYWEAHEVWEAVWLRTTPNSRENYLLRGLIQSANACLKAALARPRAANRLWALAAAEFANARTAPGNQVMGCDPDHLVAIAQRNGSCDQHMTRSGAGASFDRGLSWNVIMSYNAC